MLACYSNMSTKKNEVMAKVMAVAVNAVGDIATKASVAKSTSAATVASRRKGGSKSSYSIGNKRMWS